MKKQLLIGLGLLVASSTFAQTQKGNGILSGGLSVDYERQQMPYRNGLPDPGIADQYSNWTPALSLTAGRFWTDNWLAGLSLTATSVWIEQRLDYGSHELNSSRGMSVTATPFVRRYWAINSIYLFAGAGVSVSVSGSRQSVFDNTAQTFIKDGQESSHVGVNPRVEAGVHYFLTNRLGFQLTASAASLPLTTAGLSAGLVYWTGPDRHAEPQAERTNPQTERGRWLLEGSFSANTQKSTQRSIGSVIDYQSRVTSYLFNPSVAYFMKKNSLVGISLPVTYNSERTLNDGSTTPDNPLWSFGFSPYYQHYWTSTRLTPYTRLSVGYSRHTARYLKGNEMNAGASVGLAYMAGRRFIIETSLASARVNFFSGRQENRSEHTEIWNAGLSAGLTGNFAIRYVL